VNLNMTADGSAFLKTRSPPEGIMQMGSSEVKWPTQDKTGAGKKRSLLFMVVLLVPVAITTFVTYRSTLVETGLVENSLHSQAEMVSRGLEASLNVGMMHSAWTREILQDLLDANIRASGASLIFLSSPEGVIASSSGPLELKHLPEELYLQPPGSQVPENGLFLREPDLYVFRRALDGGREKLNSPLNLGGMMRMHRALTILPDNLFITVVLDAAGTSTLKGHHLRMNLVTAFLLIISIAGIAGWGFWSQRARETAVALARTESYAGEIVTRMPAGLIFCDAAGRIAITNPGAAHILGIPEDQLQWKSAQEIFPERILSCESLRSGKDHPVTEGTMVVDDRKLTINLSATLVPGEGDEPGGFLILFQDISELENLRDKLARSERLAEIGELSSTVAHEIRNPLSSIRGLAQLLSGKVPEGQGALMDTIVKEVDRLNRVVSGLLSYARQENLHPREWDIGNILEHVKVLADGDARLNNIEMEIETAPEGLSCLSWSLDRDMIIQALLNLVMNAMEASSAGQKVKLSAAVEGDNLFFRVTDEGAGVPENSEKLFSLFETTKENGTGLGLPLVRKVAQLHGGNASIRRVTIKGSEASMWLAQRGWP
jgi:two-component system sensor histidine kinase HydH